MDQEIEAQSRDFLAFLERCYQQSRASATSNIALCIKDIQSFLELLQPVLEPTSSSTNIPIAIIFPDVSELYPTLGRLLVQLCRNPVILASEPVAVLVAQTVLKYSTQTELSVVTGSGYGGKDDRSSMERTWCANRMRDMLQTQSQASIAKLKDGGSMSRSVGESRCSGGGHDNGFATLFQISDEEMRMHRVRQTIESLSQSLGHIRGAVGEMSELGSTAKLRKMVIWNQQLSGLCTPLVLYGPTSAVLTEGIVDMAYTLQIKASLDSLSFSSSFSSSSVSFLDNAFVEQVLILSKDEGYITGDRLLPRLCSVSTLARQRLLIQLIDTIMTASAQHPGFTMSREELIRIYIDPSQLFSAVEMAPHEERLLELEQSVLEDISGMVGEISDWRFVRVCVVLVEQIVTRGQGQGQGQRPSSDNMFVDVADLATRFLDAEDECHASGLFKAMISNARLIMQQSGGQGTSTRIEDSSEIGTGIERFLTTVQDYVFCSAGPDQLVLRRRLAFLATTAVAQHAEFLIYCVRNHFEDLEKSSDVATACMPSVVSFIVRLILVHEPNLSRSKAVGEQISELLQGLQLLCSRSGRNSESKTSVDEDLRRTLGNYQNLLKMHSTLVADLVCAMVTYMEKDDAVLWQTMIKAALSITNELNANADISSWPIIARLRDIAESARLSGLEDALISITVATNAT